MSMFFVCLQEFLQRIDLKVIEYVVDVRDDFFLGVKEEGKMIEVKVILVVKL